ncbi:flagellar biosynthesis protein FlhF [Sediminispirochaeta bajacaliforniensis]|uniref:flagellar biosynthesis protein FlhF n=1 Tax=Sediminispirochaeta bajacaliforniensis TaxID=148 RepID=UPI0003695E2F|nr:flagellar biosynthesis protein FlhF [Sediminispirochaeta bajacaliforniensis]
MQYFTEQAYTHQEVLRKIREKYGERAKILTQRSIRMGGFLGMFSKEGVEMSGYIAQDPGPRPKKSDLADEKKKILESVRGEKTLQQLLDEVRGLREKIEEGPYPVKAEKHQSIEKIERLLSENEFTYTYITAMVERLRKELSVDQLEDFQLVQDKVLGWIMDTILLAPRTGQDGPQVMILIGPTGVGKTTTIAKMAAIHSLGTKGEKQKSVRLITIDNYRIGARQQIETYGDIMGVPVSCVETYQELQKQVLIYKDTDLVLVDTIGKSPKDYVNLAKMREMLSACGTRAEVHLALSATTKASDVKDILAQFEPFGYSSVVLTKLDETMRIGNIISSLYEKRKILSYITNGQSVPEDILQADRMVLLKTLEGFDLRETFIRKEEEEGITEVEQRYLSGKEWR